MASRHAVVLPVGVAVLVAVAALASAAPHSVPVKQRPPHSTSGAAGDSFVLPPDWQARAQRSELLASPSWSSDLNLNPSVSNGYIATVVGQSQMFAAGVFNNRVGVEHQYVGADRAVIPSPVLVDALPVPSTQAQLVWTGRAIDVGRAVALRRDVFAVTDAGSASAGTHNVTVEHRLYAHRVNRSLLVLEIEVDNTHGDKAIVVDFTRPALQTSSDIEFKAVDGKKVPSGSAGLEGPIKRAESEDCTRIVVSLVYSALPAAGTWVVPAGSTRMLTVLGVVRSWLDCASTPAECAGVDYMWGMSHAQQLFATHTQAWSSLWSAGGIEIGGNATLALHVNTTLYALYGTMRDDWPWGTSPGGLATDGYSGHVFWDADTWVVPPFVHLSPGLAKAHLQYRFNRINVAKTRAKACKQALRHHTLGGHELAGENMVIQQHIEGDILMLVKKYWDATHDMDWLKTQGWPLAKGIAEFWASRLELDAGDHAYHLSHMLPPDENAVGFPEPLGVKDSVYTNSIAQLSLRFGAQAAALVGDQSVPASLWLSMADNITILFDKANRRHPEYEGFPTGNIYLKGKVKQADVVLLGYPMGIDMDTDVRANDLRYYDPYYDPTGPCMTFAMTSIGYLETGDAETAWTAFLRSLYNVQKPFDVWTITPDPYNHPNDHACFNFVTAAGGWVQSLLNGYCGLKLRSDGLAVNVRPMPGVNVIRLRGVHYLGSVITVERVGDKITLKLAPKSAGPVRLLVKDSTGRDQALVPDVPLSFPPGQLLVHAQQ